MVKGAHNMLKLLANCIQNVRNVPNVCNIIEKTHIIYLKSQSNHGKHNVTSGSTPLNLPLLHVSESNQKIQTTVTERQVGIRKWVVMEFKSCSSG
jgi:hypothetical protein